MHIIIIIIIITAIIIASRSSSSSSRLAALTRCAAPLSATHLARLDRIAFTVALAVLLRLHSSRPDFTAT